MSSRLLPVCALLAFAAACAAPSTATRPPSDAKGEEQKLLEEIALLEDRRDAQGRLTTLASEGPAPIRARALWALGRVQDVRTVPTLLAALSAQAAHVRAEAAFAIGLMLQSWDPLPEGMEAQLTEALVAAEAKEQDATVQVRLLEALGKAPTSSDLGEARLRDRILHPQAEVAARAALSLGMIARRTQKLDERSVVALFGTLRADAPVALRYGGAYALAFSRATPARVALLECTRDPDADVRAMCVRGLAELGQDEDTAALQARLADAEPRVAVEAVRALIKGVERCGPQRCPALDALKDAAGWVARLPTAPAWNQPLLAFAQAGLPARGQEVLAHVRSAVTSALEAQPTSDLAWLDCRFAAAQDRLAGALVETLRCGKGQVPDALRLSHALREIARTPVPEGQSRSTEAWGTYLQHPSPTVRNAALEALSASKATWAIPTIRTLLGSEDPIVAANASFALAALGDRASIPMIRALVERAPDELDLAPVTGALADLVRPADPATPEEEVAQKAQAQEVTRTLRPWLDSPHASLRTHAAAAIEKLTGEKLRPEVVPFPLVGGSSAPGTRLTFNAKDGVFAQPIPPPSAQLRFETNKGTFVVKLDLVEAPLTSANLFGLARRGYFDGLLFHRVVPDFVAQGGDPRGDGEGGPGYAIRCELGHRTYARGAFGMALSGKDTGGSQFFVTTSPQPHLDGRYTNFGEVTSGMEVVDRLIEGDRMIRVTAEEKTP